MAQARGNIDAVIGDEILVTFNAHVPCTDPTASATSVALNLRKQLLNEMNPNVRVQMGMAAGQMFAASAGYSAFKTMVYRRYAVSCPELHLTTQPPPTPLDPPPPSVSSDHCMTRALPLLLQNGDPKETIRKMAPATM